MRGPFSFCPYTNPPRTEYVTHQDIGSATLAALVPSLALLGNARTTFDKLRLDGYACGFEVDPVTNKPVGLPKLICTHRPTNIKYCYEAKLVMDVRWGAAAIDAMGLVNALKAAQIVQVQSSCDVPAGSWSTTGPGLRL